MISEEKAMFFDWCSDDCQQIRGKWAAVFGDAKQSEVRNVVHALRDGLSFNTTVAPNSFESLNIVGNKIRGEANTVGCFLACFFAKLTVNEQNEICIEVGSSGQYTVGEIVGKLTGPVNNKWLGRPKIFIFLHQHNTLDCGVQAKKVEIQATRSNGTLVCILNSKDAAKDFTECLFDQRLKHGSNMQEMMLGLIRKYGNNCECQFSSQLTSTMHFLLDFPDWPVIFIEPSFSVTTKHSNEDVSFDVLQKNYLFQLCDKKSKLKICFVSAKVGAGKSTLLREIVACFKKDEHDVIIVDLSRQIAIFESEHLLEMHYVLKSSGDICYDKPKSVILFDGVDVMMEEFRDQMDHLFSQMLENDASIVIATSLTKKDLKKFGMLAEGTTSSMWVTIKPFEELQQVSLLKKASARSDLECKLLLNKFDAYSDLLQSPEFVMFTLDSFETTPTKLVQKFHHQKLVRALITVGGFDQNGEKFKSIVKGYERVLQNSSLQFLEVTTNKYTLDCLQTKVLNSTGIVTVQEDGKAEFQYKSGAKLIAAQRFLIDIAQNKCNDIKVHSLKTILMFVDLVLAEYDAKQKEQLIEKIKIDKRVNFIFKSAVSAGLENIFEFLQNLFTFSVDQPDKIILTNGFLYLALAHKNSESMADSLFEMDAHITRKSMKVPVEKRREPVVSENFHEFVTINDSITCDGNKNKSILHFAVERNITRFIEFLIKKGIQTEERDAMNWNCLHFAVEYADFNIIKYLLSCDEGLIKRKTKTGLTCFHLAVYYENVETCKYLINKGVEWHSKDNFGNNALHFAAMAGKDAIVNLLVNDLEFNVNGTTNEGLTALHYAASESHLGVIRSLLSLGADRMAVTLMGWNALHFAARYADEDTVKLLTQDLVTNDLIKPLITQTTEGCSLSHLAACNYEIEIENFLLNLSNFSLEVDNMGWNLLHFACKYNNVAAVEWLLNSIEDSDFVNNTTKTLSSALILAARFASLDLCKLLVGKGATVCHVDERGKNALAYAFAAKRFKVVEFLVSKMSFYDIFISTTSRQQMRLVKYILLKGSCVNDANEKNETALFFSVRNNNYNATKILIHNGADVNHKNFDGCTPLMMAAEYAHYCIFDLLIANRAFIHCLNNNGESVLHITCKTGNFDVATRLLKSMQPLDVNIEDDDERTPLFVATQHKHEQIVQLLLANGADVNRSDHMMMTPSLVAAGNSLEIYMIFELQESINFAAVDLSGKNALHLATEHGNEKVVSHLLNQNYPPISEKDYCGCTALHIAAAFDRLEIAKLLIASGANVNDAKVVNSSTPLTIAAQYSSKEMLELLVARGATLDVKDETGDNALHCAAIGGKYENVLYLVEKEQFNTKQKGCDNGTVLHFSVQANNLSITKLLLGLKGTDINAKDKNNDTPLLLAAKYTNVETFEYLLGKNAKLRVTNNLGDSALHCAILGEKMEIVKYLVETHKIDFDLKNKKNRTPLHYAALVGNLQIAEFFITDKDWCKVTINARDKNGCTPLLIADTVEMIKFLVDHGAILEAWNIDGDTALHLNSFSGNIDVVKYLIRIKPELIKRNNLKGSTALHYASLKDFVHVAELLIKGGADVNARNRSQKTPLMFTASVEMCDLLVQNKSDPYRKDNEGNTALHFACRNGQLDIVKYLVEHDYHLLNVANRREQFPECYAHEEMHKYISDVRANYFAETRSNFTFWEEMSSIFK